MKNLMFIFLILLLVLTTHGRAQEFGEEDKQLIISYLDSTGLEFLALKQIEYYDIKEAIPVLEEKFWQKRRIIREAYLSTLTILESQNAESFALALIDSSKKYSDSLSTIMEASYNLFLLNNFSTANYVFLWLDEYHNRQGEFLPGSYIIKVLPKLLEIPEYENQIKQELFYIVRNEENADYRCSAINSLVQKYGEETIPLLIERLNQDTTSYVRWNAFVNLNELNYPDKKSVIKSFLTSESEFVYRIKLADTLLANYGHPEDYAFLKNYAQTEMDPRVKEMITLNTQYVKPPEDTATNDLKVQLDSLFSYLYQLYSFSWLGDSAFLNELGSSIQLSKTSLQNGDSIACRVQVKTFQDLGNLVYADSLNPDPRFVTREGWNLLYWNAQYILDRLPEPPANPNLLVTLTNSQGTQIPASNVMYYDQSWKDATDNEDGTFTVITTKPTVSVRMFYEGANQTVNNVPAQNNAYTFQTVNAAVELRNSSGNLIDEGIVQFYAGSWRNFGTTVNGVANKELLPINYSFRMSYEYGSIDKQQNISVDPTVVFQTIDAAVELRNSLGNFIDEGTVQYYAGAWRSFGTTVNGVANKELLPINYSFRMTYEYVSNDKQQDLSTNSTVTFSTVLCTLKVTNANNQPLEGADTKYYSGAWRDIGLTNANGEITKELLPKNLSFRAIYGNESQDKQQDITTNNLVEINLSVGQ